MARRKEPIIPDANVDQLLAGADPKTIFDPNGLIDNLKKAFTERVLNAEMDHHLDGDEEAGNRRNGYGKKTVMTDSSSFEVEIPRDREASFDPQLITRYQRRFPGFDDKVISMYARGMSTREIVGHLRELYGIGQSDEALSAENDMAMLEAGPCQAKVIEDMVEGLAGDRHAETAQIGEVGQPQPARFMRLAEDHLLLLAMHRTP